MSHMKSVGQKNISLIFCNLEQIINVNKDFLSQLELAKKDLLDFKLVANVFIVSVISIDGRVKDSCVIHLIVLINKLQISKIIAYYLSQMSRNF